VKCGIPNLRFDTFDACVNATVAGEGRGHGASFFTSQMQGYYEPEVLEAVTGRRLGSCLIAEDRSTLRELANSRVARFYTLLLGADRGAQWRDRGYRHPLGDDWGYARNATPGRATAAELNAAVDEVPPEAVGDMAFFMGTRDEVAATLGEYAAAGLSYASIVDYSGRIDPSLAQPARDNVEFLIRELQNTEKCE
jgi:phthiodiolone/phenolphthiodiolone dimycocerosates ketoreductase